MPTLPGEGPPGDTIGQVFDSKGLWKWFSSTPTNYYDGQSEKGEDFGLSFGAPIGIPVGGKVVRIVHHNNSIGDIVEVQDASGAVWLYQHITAKVAVGQNLGVGSVVGTENGLPPDQYSTGTHIEVRYCPAGQWHIGLDSWYEPWVNPRGIFSSLANQAAGPTGSTPPTVGGTIGTVTSTVVNSLTPDADVALVFWTMDQALQIKNPFDVVEEDFNAGPFSFPNPIAWTAQVATNIFYDFSASVVRAVLYVMGLLIIIKVSSAFIDYGAIADAAQQAGAAVGKAVALAA